MPCYGQVLQHRRGALPQVPALFQPSGEDEEVFRPRIGSGTGEVEQAEAHRASAAGVGVLPSVPRAVDRDVSAPHAALSAGGRRGVPFAESSL